VSVQIDEMEVVPREPRDRSQQQQPEGGSTSSGPPQPDLDHQIASAVALMRARDLRLLAD
jgi:hypothetical protein